jgi:cobalamin synthase
MGSESSQAGGGEEVATGARSGEVAALARGVVAAVAFATGAQPGDAEAAARLARGMLFLPAIGFAIGLGAGALAAALARWIPPLAAAPLIVGLLLAVQRAAPARAIAEGVARDGAPVGGRGLAAASAAIAALLVLQALAIASLAGSALVLGLALAVMLGRWAIVVQAYGSVPAPGDAIAAALVPRIEFREFGVASVSAMAIALALANAVGVVLVVGSAAVAIGLRIAAHRRRGGVALGPMVAGGMVVETAALLVASALARAIGG